MTYCACLLVKKVLNLEKSFEKLHPLGNKVQNCVSLNICHFSNDITKDINATQENLFIKKFVVIMQQNRCVVHRRKSKSRNTNFSDISTIEKRNILVYFNA